MSENENDFESLRRLMTLKRHETPPPGYFNNFSDLVLQRIRSDQSKESVDLSYNLFTQAPWLARLLNLFNVKPVFASGFVGAICMVLFFGIVYAERPDLTPEPQLQTEVAPTSFAALSPAALSQSAPPMGIVSSTNPVLSLQPVAANFGQPNPLAQPVSFQLPGN
jgi:hypothetical protein